MNYFVNEPYTAYRLKKEYKALCEIYHPFNGGDHDTFIHVTEEYYNILENINKHKQQTESTKRYNERQRIYKVIKDNEPPAEGMTLEPIPCGVAITGPKELTYANRIKIKVHGGIWYNDVSQWRAYDEVHIKMLCNWFGVSYEWMLEQIKEKTNPTLGTIAKMIANSQPLDGITNIAIGRFRSINKFLKVFHELYQPVLERLSEGIVQHKDMTLLRNFADDMLLAFGFDMPENKESEKEE